MISQKMFPLHVSIVHIRRTSFATNRAKKKWAIDLYFNQHKTYAEIAQIE